MSVRCRIADGTILRVHEQVDQQARLRPLKFRKKGDYRDIPLPQYVADAIDKHIAGHGTTSDGYLYQGRKYKLVIRRSYQQDFTRSAAKAGLPPQFVPHSLRHYFASSDVAAVRGQMAGHAEERELALKLAEEQEVRANAFFEQRESALAELAERDQRVLDLENLVRSLRMRLVATGKAAEALVPAEEQPGPPATFAELSDWMDAELTRIEFTGDRDTMLALDRCPEASTWVRSSWEVLRAMQSYADAKAGRSFAGDFKTWCENPPSDSYVISSGKVARDESETVKNNAKWERQREFPVPAAVDPSGRKFMGAHIRIGASGQISPRLYFHDATASTGKIYVGYLGRHLTKTLT